MSKLRCPEGVGSINIGGTEYTAADGQVEIGDPVHVEVAKANGFVDPTAAAADVVAAPRKKLGE